MLGSSLISYLSYEFLGYEDSIDDQDPDESGDHGLQMNIFQNG